MGKEVQLSLNGVVAKEATPAYPQWVEALRPYFDFEGSYTSKARKYYRMKCKTCKASISDKGKESFRDHLKKHPRLKLQYEEELRALGKRKADDGQSVLDNCVSFDQNRKKRDDTAIEKFKMTEPKQAAFRESLLKFVVLDGVSFNIVEGQGFKDLISGLEQRLTIPSRRTLLRDIEIKHNEVKEKISRNINAQWNKSKVHLIMDIWTSRQNTPILGVIVRYCDPYNKIRHEALGFIHFPERHTSENIRTLLEGFLEAAKIPLSQVISVTTDNAANMIKAFSISPEIVQANLESQDDEAPLLELDETDEAYLNTSELELISSVAELKRTPCLAHLLQLCVKDAFTNCAAAAKILKTVTDVIGFFSKSVHASTELKEITGRVLLKAILVRWNSVYHCLKRMVSKEKNKDGEMMLRSVNKILLKMSKESNTSSKIPGLLRNANELVALCKILEPVAKLTDYLQQDGVTSSLAILGVIQAVKALENLEIPIRRPSLQHTVDFRNKLVDAIMHRFALSGEDGSPTRKFAVNIFDTKEYIIASLLDPRVKTAPFEGLAAGTALEELVKNVDNAKNVLIDAAKNFIPDIDVEIQEEGEPQNEPKKASFSLFDGVQKSKAKATPVSSFIEEFESYLKKPNIPEDEDPLAFWRSNKSAFPKLAEMAQVYLLIPATSGSIERLFSIAGAICRVRRARITPSNLEKILCIRQYLLNTSMYGNKIKSEDNEELKFEKDDLPASTHSDPDFDLSEDEL